MNSALRILKLGRVVAGCGIGAIMHMWRCRMDCESDRFQMTKELGRKLRELRERARLTQTDLAPDRLDRQLRRK